ncbi:glycosyltransferase [Paracoccaceae bacterium]|nr:glycosyltransferase [Paracoccaceae bacterium]
MRNLNLLYCSAYYDEYTETGANIRFKEIGCRLPQYCDITTLTPTRNQKKTFSKHSRLRFLWAGRLAAAIEIFIRFKLGKYDVLITDLAPTVPSHNTYFMIHDLRQFTKFKRHRRMFSDYLYSLNLKVQKKFVTVSHFTREELLNIGIKASEIVVSYNGVEPIDSTLHCSDKKIDILYVATFEERKNHALLIGALAEFKNFAPNFRCLLLGRDLGTLDEVRNLVNENKLLANITFIESCSDFELYNLYKQTRVFVSTSLYEGFGMPLIEALNHGLIVVCGDIPVFTELSEKHFRFYKQNSKSSLINVLKEAYSSRSSEQDASDFIRQQFDWGRITEKLVSDIQFGLGKP